MVDILLKKRTYLGDGYVHQYVNETNPNDIKIVPCKKAEYEALGNNGRPPDIKGYKWQGSSGGTVMVDTDNTILGENEYCELPNGVACVRLSGDKNIERDFFVAKTAIVSDTIKEETAIAAKTAAIQEAEIEGLSIERI